MCLTMMDMRASKNFMKIVAQTKFLKNQCICIVAASQLTSISLWCFWRHLETLFNLSSQRQTFWRSGIHIARADRHQVTSMIPRWSCGLEKAGIYGNSHLDLSIIKNLPEPLISIDNSTISWNTSSWTLQFLKILHLYCTHISTDLHLTAMVMWACRNRTSWRSHEVGCLYCFPHPVNPLSIWRYWMRCYCH